MNSPFTGVKVKVKQDPTDGDRAEISGKCIFIKTRLQIFAVQQVFQRVSLSQLVSRKSKHKNRGFGTNHHQVSLSSDYISRNILRVKFQMLCSDGSRIYDI